MKFMMALSNNTIKAIAPNMKASTAALSTTAAKLDQAYRIEADTFGELKVICYRIDPFFIQSLFSGSSREILWSPNTALSDEFPHWRSCF